MLRRVVVCALALTLALAPAGAGAQVVGPMAPPPGACRLLTLEIGPEFDLDLNPFYLEVNPANATLWFYGPLSPVVCLFFPRLPV